jgi:hypothetical protein
MTGSGFIKELAEFSKAIVEIRPGFQRKLGAMEALFGSKDVGFVLVTTPSAGNYQDFLTLSGELKQRQYELDAVVLNRSLGVLSGDLAGPAGELLRVLVAHEKEIHSRILKGLDAKARLIQCPELTRDVHTLEDLKNVASCLDLFGDARDG